MVNDRNKINDKNRNNKPKKAAAIILCAAILITVAYFATKKISEAVGNKMTKTGREDKTEKIIFSPVIANEDITKDREYMGYDRQFYFEDPTTGITVVADEKLTDVPEQCKDPVSCLRDYLAYAINGNGDGILSLRKDLEESPEITPQKLYDIRMTYVSYDALNENGTSVEKWCFWLEYKIKDNNGTFRNDMGSNCSRKEYVQLSKRKGATLIDSVEVWKTVK